MRRFALLAAAAAVCLATGCGSTCGPSNCNGCCSAAGECLSSTDQACGAQGSACQSCTGSQHCSPTLSQCVFSETGGNGNGGNGSTSAASTSSGSNGSSSTTSASGSSGTSSTGSVATSGSGASTGTAGSSGGASTGSSCAQPGVWVNSVVDADLQTGLDVRMVVDSSGTVHASYNAHASDFSVYEQRYAYKPAGGTWTVARVGDPNAGGNTAIALDPSDGVHVAFNAACGIQYGYQAPGTHSFAMQTVLTETGSCPAATSLGADRNGVVHVIFRDNNASALEYTEGAIGSSFSTPSPLDSTAGNVGICNAAVVTPGGSLQAVYNTAQFQGLAYALRLGSGSITPETIGADPANISAIAVDAQGAAHVVYDDTEGTSNTPFNVKFADQPAGTFNWNIGYIEQGSAIYPSVALDANGGEHVAYRTFGEIRYAYRPSGGTFTPESVQTLGAEGSSEGNERVAIAVDGSGTVHILYYDWINAQLGYAFKCQ